MLSRVIFGLTACLLLAAALVGCGQESTTIPTPVVPTDTAVTAPAATDTAVVTAPAATDTAIATVTPVGTPDTPTPEPFVLVTPTWAVVVGQGDLSKLDDGRVWTYRDFNQQPQDPQFPVLRVYAYGLKETAVREYLDKLQISYTPEAGPGPASPAQLQVPLLDTDAGKEQGRATLDDNGKGEVTVLLELQVSDTWQAAIYPGPCGRKPGGPAVISLPPVEGGSSKTILTKPTLREMVDEGYVIGLSQNQENLTFCADLNGVVPGPTAPPAGDEDLVIIMELLGFPPPYRIAFVLDPSLTSGFKHTYAYTFSNQTETIKAHSGGYSALIAQNSTTKAGPVSADTDPGTGAIPTQAPVTGSGNCYRVTAAATGQYELWGRFARGKKTPGANQCP